MSCTNSHKAGPKSHTEQLLVRSGPALTCSDSLLPLDQVAFLTRGILHCPCLGSNSLPWGFYRLKPFYEARLLIFPFQAGHGCHPASSLDDTPCTPSCAGRQPVPSAGLRTQGSESGSGEAPYAKGSFHTPNLAVPLSNGTAGLEDECYLYLVRYGHTAFHAERNNFYLQQGLQHLLPHRKEGTHSGHPAA